MQNRKILFNKKIKSIENVHKKIYTKKLFVDNFINKKFKTFYQLQDFFSRLMIFYHFDFKLQLFIDFDVSKEFKIDEHVYYVFIDLKHFQNKFFNKKNPHSKKNKMKSIMFFSREFIYAKIRYWPTEMKVVALI